MQLQRGGAHDSGKVESERIQVWFKVSASSHFILSFYFRPSVTSTAALTRANFTTKPVNSAILS